MSYCLGMRLNEGLVFLSDSRTNAGVDFIASFRKMFIFDECDDRCLVLMSAGNLAITQAVVAQLTDRLSENNPERSLYAAQTLFDAAKIIGKALRDVHEHDAPALAAQGVEFSASFIFGGQINGAPHRLFYSAGNFVEATKETPYFQIGETKYGKPILERVLRPESPLVDAVKCGLVSFNSTIRANLSVGPPLDLAIMLKDQQRIAIRETYEATDPYVSQIATTWGDGLRALFTTLPDPDWKQQLVEAQHHIIPMPAPKNDSPAA